MSLSSNRAELMPPKTQETSFTQILSLIVHLYKPLLALIQQCIFKEY